MIWVLVIILLIYTVLIAEFALSSWRWDIEDINTQHPDAEGTADPIRFTVIIPYRNEAQHLPRLLEHIRALNYPKDLYEVLLVNDASEDDSLEIITSFLSLNTELPIICIDNLRKTGSPKKDAISTAITLSKFEWMVTTDADCTFSPNWLKILATFIKEKRPKMVVGPVCIDKTDSPSFLNAFEQLDFLSLMGATIGGFAVRRPFLCNGAHLAYHKEAFKEVQGFADNDHIASGDDHFLLEKFAQQFPQRVNYLKSQKAMITTQPQKSWQSFISQRVRWASKGTGYTYWFSKFAGIVVLLANLSVVVAFVYGAWSLVDGLTVGGSLYIFAKAGSPQFLFLSVFLKFLVDYWLIFKTARFMERASYLKWFSLVALCYPFVSAYIAILALTSDFAWKGRRYKR